MVSGAEIVVTTSLKDRFLSHVKKAKTLGSMPSACWEWTGYRDKNGYGRFALPQKKNIQAHRMAYLLFIGSLGTGLSVCHKCDNPSCVRPSHLFLASHADNMRDRNKKGRTAAGERNGNYQWKARKAATNREAV